jgi:ubiquinone/menaquinone biosynthesis C-methylase UbiE
MMIEEIFPAPLYTFLDYANDIEIEKCILDCGAGGTFPKLALFAINGYESHGIEILTERLEMAEKYAEENNLDLKLVEGNMNNLPYETESFGFVFTYNTIFHMDKKEIGIIFDEMFRVLKRGGLLYANLLSVDDKRYGCGEETKPGTYTEEIDGEKYSHTYFTYEEGESYFKNHKIIYKQIRIEKLAEFYENGDDYLRGMIDYIIRKE